jgi:hypothetical protein
MFSLMAALIPGVALALAKASLGIAEDAAQDAEAAYAKRDYVSASEEYFRGETQDDP